MQLHEVEFRSCTVKIHDWGIETRFKEDDSISIFVPPNKPDFIEAAKYAGYGEDYWRHGIEHDLVHAWLSDYLDLPHSWSVWSSAHGTGTDDKPWSQRVRDEEHLVVSLQRYLNTGLLDSYGHLYRTFGSDLPRASEELRALLKRYVP